MAFIIIYKNQGFAFGVNITAITYPKNIAAAIPPAVAIVPPVNIPKKPSFLIPSITPFPSEYPNPIIGTVAPAAPKSTILYIIAQFN